MAFMSLFNKWTRCLSRTDFVYSSQGSHVGKVEWNLPGQCQFNSSVDSDLSM